MRLRRIAWLPVAGLFILAGCGGGDSTPDNGEMGGAMDEEAPVEAVPMEEPTATGTVTIVQPADGSEVQGPNVDVVLETTGIRVVEAGVMEPGTGHHHLFLDVDATPLSQVIPANLPNVIHMGDGTSVRTLENVSPGEHRLIAIVADGQHVPLDPPVVDTVNFTVVGEGAGQ
jgi:hypothetical protein